MTIDTERFKEYARRGIDAVIDGAKKGAEIVREAGDGAIDRVDILRLERRLEAARAALGAVAYALLEARAPVLVSDPDIAAAMEKVRSAGEALERKKAAYESRTRATDDGKK